MSTTDKRSNNPKFIQEIRRGDKEIDEIKVVVEFCTMPNELKDICVDKARTAMSKFFFYLI